MQSTEGYLDGIERLRQALSEAGAVLIGAGAGLSTAAGFTYDGERFELYFGDFEKKYGFTDMYSGGFYHYPSLEEYWAFWSLQIKVNRYVEAPKPVYSQLLELVRDKDYFVITTNVDHCFQKAGIAKERLYYMQGDFGVFQCSGPCRQETYDNEQQIRMMVELQKDLRIPSELVPYCPHCGRPMTTNLRIDGHFVEDDGWHKASRRYSKFLKAHENSQILFLELGVGYNTPGIIKYPFWRMTAQNPNAVYACINKDEAECPTEIEMRSICINEDIEEACSQLIGDRAGKSASAMSSWPRLLSAERK